MGAKTYRDAQGYLRFKDSGRLVHRWKAEKSLGRKLHPGEVVHHKNSFKTDNRNSNLRVFSSSAKHRAHHIKRAWEQTRRRRSVRRRSGRKRR
ncbi:MAG: HNH endonuclease [Candidatus Thorarchaeota archaeon]